MLTNFSCKRNGFDTAENEPSKVCKKRLSPCNYFLSVLRSILFHPTLLHILRLRIRFTSDEHSIESSILLFSFSLRISECLPPQFLSLPHMALFLLSRYIFKVFSDFLSRQSRDKGRIAPARTRPNFTICDLAISVEIGIFIQFPNFTAFFDVWAAKNS